MTDPPALFPLLPFLKRFKRIWEPCCGVDRLSNTMRLDGHEVLSTDIYRGQNFFDYFSVPEGVDAIVTNPPYTVKTQFLRRCFELGKPFALLLPYTTLGDGLERKQLFDKYGLEILVLKNRVKFTTPSGKVGGSWFPVGWFCKDILPASPRHHIHFE